MAQSWRRGRPAGPVCDESFAMFQRRWIGQSSGGLWSPRVMTSPTGSSRWPEHSARTGSVMGHAEDEVGRNGRVEHQRQRQHRADAP